MVLMTSSEMIFKVRTDLINEFQTLYARMFTHINASFDSFFLLQLKLFHTFIHTRDFKNRQCSLEATVIYFLQASLLLLLSGAPLWMKYDTTPTGHQKHWRFWLKVYKCIFNLSPSLMSFRLAF